VSDNVYLARLDTVENTLTYAQLDGLPPQVLLNKDKITLSTRVRLPLDGVVYVRKSAYDFEKDFLHPFQSISVLFRSGTVEYVDMNAFDHAKFIFLSQLANRMEEEVQWVDGSSDTVGNYDEDLYSLFHNKAFIANNFSVEVVNASSINGVGSLLAQILENDGYNIVSVRSSPLQSSAIEMYEQSNQEALAHLFNYFHLPPSQGDKQPIVSVSLIIGEQLAERLAN